MVNGKINGLRKKGIMAYISSKILISYEGEFRKNKYDGSGELRFKNGDKFIGTFRDGKRVSGVQDFNDGSIYDGLWDKDKIGSQGVYTHAEHSTYAFCPLIRA